MSDVSYIKQYACISSIVALYLIDRGKWKYITFFGIVCLAQYICVYYLDTFVLTVSTNILLYRYFFPFYAREEWMYLYYFPQNTICIAYSSFTLYF